MMSGLFFFRLPNETLMRCGRSEVSVMVADWVKQEDENRWRCTECKKLFKAGPFVEKHVINKHPEHFKGKLDEVSLHNATTVSP